MEADKLVGLREGLMPRLIEPVGVALVKLRSQALRRRAIDGLLYENVAEAELALPHRPNEPTRARGD